MYMGQEIGCPFSEVNTSQLAASHHSVHDGCFLGRIMVSTEHIVLSAMASDRTLFSLALSKSCDNATYLQIWIAMHILAFSLCKESDAHRSIATHYFKERGSIPYGQDSFK